MVSMNKSSKTISKHTSKAFAPGHITGFFQPIYDKDNPLQTGSRGAGISLSLGCHTSVSVDQADSLEIEIITNTINRDDPVVRRCVELLIPHDSFHITIHNKLELPIGQGFGMSAASSLGVSLALSECLHLSPKKALYAAHQAEVECKTGLGDVVASFTGGMEIRKYPGVLSDEVIQPIPGSINLVLCVIDSSMKTEKILSDEDRMKEITAIGKTCTDSLLKNSTIEEFFSLSQLFTERSGLASEKILQAIQEVNEYGMASMCMLGNAIFAMGNVKDLVQILHKHGSVYQTRVDTIGARLM